MRREGAGRPAGPPGWTLALRWDARAEAEFRRLNAQRELGWAEGAGAQGSGSGPGTAQLAKLPPSREMGTQRGPAKRLFGRGSEPAWRVLQTVF